MPQKQHKLEQMHKPESVLCFPLFLGKLKVWSLHLALATGVGAVCSQKKSSTMVECIGASVHENMVGMPTSLGLTSWVIVII